VPLISKKEGNGGKTRTHLEKIGLMGRNTDSKEKKTLRGEEKEIKWE